MQKPNYQKEMDQLLDSIKQQGRTPHLLLHSCCAPCSSYVLEYLTPYFQITDLFYNPNIYPANEYDMRKCELERLIGEAGYQNPVTMMPVRYDPERFFEMAKGLEDVPEGGERCFACYRLRLEEAARAAKELGADYFATTLTISPLKNAAKLNEIGLELEKIYDISYLPSDFKKKNGYKRSTELSAEYGLYRQNYCGCVFSKAEAKKREDSKRMSTD